ncbi:anthranilate synthase component II [Bacillus fonticola]|uniref:anthranilate synthase component II n=1 Tax=Bacillus fonticola TaxID=2728853 RepID=UPI001475168E|nr:aminodeoxychorismate/anthranilate synthase component II [Bacillus fonticola]
MILLLDNYDSFTYNLYQQIAQYKEVEVVRNDEQTAEELLAKMPEAIILSPGPGHPRDAGMMMDLIQKGAEQVPMLGICLGHQAIFEAFGGTIRQAKRIMHGKRSNIQHDGEGVFAYMPQPLQVMRYHSLTADHATCPSSLAMTATSMDDGEVMAIRHRTKPIFGFQFHPESIGTGKGNDLIAGFFQQIEHSKEVTTK